jgi:hypothetical protein
VLTFSWLLTSIPLKSSCIHLIRSRKPRLTTVGVRCADHATPSIRKSWQYFANKRRLLGRHCSLADQSHEVLVFSLYSSNCEPILVLCCQHCFRYLNFRMSHIEFLAVGRLDDLEKGKRSCPYRDSNSGSVASRIPVPFTVPYKHKLLSNQQRSFLSLWCCPKVSAHTRWTPQRISRGKG